MELQRLLGASVGPPGFVVTLRRHDEYELLLERIEALEDRLKLQERQLHQMSEYAVLYLTALDDLKRARNHLVKLGVDTSFIRSLHK